MPRLPRITGKQAVSALTRMGFVTIQIRGSHVHLHRLGMEGIVTVPVHSGEILAPKTLKSILRQAGISVQIFMASL